LQEKGDLDGAEALLRRVLVAKQRLYPGDHEAVAVGLNNLGKLLQERKNLAEAEPLYREALAMRRRLAKSDFDPDVARSANNLATLLEARKAIPEAEKLHRDSTRTGPERACRPGEKPQQHRDVLRLHR
jgi:tetratricopeptide (TPR) repeat protein